MAERLTARKCSLHDLLAGEYVVKANEPNQLVTPHGPASRANIIAAVVAKPGNAALLLDDGSGQAEARAFDDQKLFDNILLGDIILLIGRPRKHEGRPYIVAEIAKRLGSPKWLELRKAELAQTEKAVSVPKKKNSPVAPRPVSEEKKDGKGEEGLKKAKDEGSAKPVTKTAVEDEGEVVALTSERVLAAIKELDDGAGAPMERIVARLGGGAETALTDLMAEGEIFEIRPGRVKVLE